MTSIGSSFKIARVEYGYSVASSILIAFPNNDRESHKSESFKTKGHEVVWVNPSDKRCGSLNNESSSKGSYIIGWSIQQI
ncbi:hypothetical protein CEXT_711841 [Caerostris extrusa]|uniref:Uncharacterized protein n=1 Tax=Caerostris extrusa TaxID=172846 RepID=A0AAV4T171_CAEEX|nr:hypothetical protein CEXT_711841 [Caerostris extrusa]